jgi:hypothetical protein
MMLFAILFLIFILRIIIIVVVVVVILGIWFDLFYFCGKLCSFYNRYEFFVIVICISA